MDLRIGDRVICKHTCKGVTKGELGTIQDFTRDNRDVYVRWDSENRMRHNNNNRCELLHGWMVPLPWLERCAPLDLGNIVSENSQALLDLFGGG